MKAEILSRAGQSGHQFMRFVLSAVYSAFFITLFISPSYASAQEATCGDIVAPRYFLEHASTDQTIDREQISDCSDPFGETTNPPSPYSLKIDGNEVISGEVVTVAVGGTRDFRVDGFAYGTEKELFLFKHEGYDYVYLDINSPEITDQQIIDYGAVYFAGSPDRALYQEVIAVYFGSGNIDEYFYDENGDEILDSTGTSILSQLYIFLDSAETTLLVPPPLVQAGTYTMVIEQNFLLLTERTWQQQMRDFFIKTAYAQEFIPPNIYTITFTIVEGEAVTGPVSVLFLPGIMGSRLFEESDVCNLFGGVDKVERWVSTFDCDTERLLMDENGQSVYPLFTEAEGGVVEDVAVASNLYDSFFEDLAQWKEEGKIADYRGVPYDWRLRLDDILKTINTGGRITLDAEADYQDGYVYKSLEAMVAASPSERVVLVGHSNGGLVIKTLLATMKANNDPLLDSVEKVMLVAVPQAGTPESVVGMLHGVDIGIAGVAVSEEQSRKLINTAPFGYHLLPSADYFDMVDTPVIAIEDGTSTSAWRGQFGAELDTKVELNYFLEKGSGRATPEWSDLLTPATAYSHLLGYANNVHNFMQDWKPDEALVYEVAGTGIETPATIKYFSDFTCLRTEIGMGGVTRCVEPGTKLGYRVDKVIDGDGTVVTPSALALPLSGGSNKWFVDLESYSKSSLITRKHKNIFEVQEVIDLVSDVVSSSTLGGYNFISKTEPSFEGKSRLVYQLHSPLDLYVILGDGEVVGSSTPSLRGVEYSRYGELQQLSIPENETDYEIRLSGLATGSFTLDIDSYDGDVLADRQTYSAVPSSTSTQVSLKVEENDEAVLEIDYQGDGFFEATVIPGLAVVVPTLVSTTTLIPETKSKSSSTKVKDRSLPSAPQGELSGGQVVTYTQYEFMLKLITLLTQYRDLLIKIKVQ